MEIYQFPTRGDNFGVLLHDPGSEATAAVDAPDADDVRKALSDKGWILTHILVTHHHHDHTAGIVPLKKLSGCVVVGPEAEQDSIPGLDVTAQEGDTVEVGNMRAQVIETPGHTHGHISYFLPNEPAAFVGDTIFSIGCGRLLECDAKTMWSSLQKLMTLPPETAIYCGHEYTQANARFALTLEPGNETLQARAKQVEELRRQGKATLPTTLAQELETNPFLRPDSPEIQERLGMTGKPLDEIFGEIRRRKDAF